MIAPVMKNLNCKKSQCASHFFRYNWNALLKELQTQFSCGENCPFHRKSEDQVFPSALEISKRSKVIILFMVNIQITLAKDDVKKKLIIAFDHTKKLMENGSNAKIPSYIKEKEQKSSKKVPNGTHHDGWYQYLHHLVQILQDRYYEERIHKESHVSIQ